jgi:hypothetical protein
MNHEQTILEQFREREKEIKKECEKLDAEMDKKRRESERVQGIALDKLTKARADLEKMKRDYHNLTSELESQAKIDLEATHATVEKVKAGEVSMDTFIRDGLSPDAIKVKAEKEVRAKMAAAVKIIRDKAAEIFTLELEEAEARRNVIYCATYPGQTQIKKLEAEIETLKRGVGAIFGGYYQADVTVERAKADIRLCTGKSIDSVTWDDIGYDELLTLRLDPRITNIEHFKALDGLEEIIAGAKPGKRYYLVMAHANGMGRENGFIVRQLDADEGMITTTTTSAPGKK